MNEKCCFNINILSWSTACHVLLVREKKETKKKTISLLGLSSYHISPMSP